MAPLQVEFLSLPSEGCRFDAVEFVGPEVAAFGRAEANALADRLTAELAAGSPFRYPKKENSVANQELARRVLQPVDGAEVGRERPQHTPAAAHHPPQAAAHHPGRLWRSALGPGRLCALRGRASARQAGVAAAGAAGAAVSACWRGAC